MDVKKWGVGVLGAVALFAAGFVGVIAIGPAQAEEGASGAVNAVRSFFGGEKMDEKIAAKLGVTVEQLRQARIEARDEILQEAIAAGRLTQEQADRMRSGGFRGMGGPHGPRGGHGQAFYIQLNVHEIAAQTLNLTPEALRAELRQGKSLAQVASERGVARDVLKNAIVGAHREAINQALANGRITQEQADRAVQNLEARIDALLDAVRGAGMMKRTN